MKKMSKMLIPTGIILTTLVCIALLNFPTGVSAAAKVEAVEGMSYNANASIEDNLKSLVGKRITVILDSGNTLTGYVKTVGNHLVHLEKLVGKDFFDALIRINSIIAIEARFRAYKR